MPALKILLGGVPLGCDNVGDEAIITCVVQLLREIVPEAELTVSARKEEKTASMTGLTLPPNFSGRPSAVPEQGSFQRFRIQARSSGCFFPYSSTSSRVGV